MVHKDWCGESCKECQTSCSIDKSTACLPDCVELNSDGTRNAQRCAELGCESFAPEEGQCPVCGNRSLTYGQSYLQDAVYTYEWGCKGCGTLGKELHCLTFVTQLID